LPLPGNRCAMVTVLSGVSSASESDS
jgi:hypothetical protein